MHDYWANNTFELAARVKRVRELLKPRRAMGVNYIRVGSAHDGGYILADNLDVEFVISCGIADNVDFEKGVAASPVFVNAAISRGYGAIEMYDYSIDTLPESVPYGIFYKRRIGVGPDDLDLNSIIRPGMECILKLDIEGAEWDVLQGAANLESCRQIAMESHWMQNLVFDAFYDAVVRSLENLRRTHTPVYIHANNNQPITTMGAQPVPWVFEALFLNNDYFEFEDEIDPFEGLVVPNDLTVPEIGLSFP